MSIKFNQAKELLISNREHLALLETRHLAIFGSTARNETQKSSDIDILVDFDAKKGLFVFFVGQYIIFTTEHTEITERVFSD